MHPDWERRPPLCCIVSGWCDAEAATARETIPGVISRKELHEDTGTFLGSRSITELVPHLLDQLRTLKSDKEACQWRRQGRNGYLLLLQHDQWYLSLWDRCWHLQQTAVTSH